MWLVYTWVSASSENKTTILKNTLGTAKWESYAYFLAGLRAGKEDNPGLARRYYLRALRIDDNFRAPRVNLVKYLAQGSGEQRQIAIKELKALIDDARKNKQAFGDTAFYSAQFNLAQLYYDQNDIGNAEQQAQQLLNDIKENIADEQNPYFQRIKPQAAIMYETIMLAKTGTIKTEEALLQNIGIARTGMSAALHYNLACYHTVASQKNPQNKESHGKNALSHLSMSVWLAPNAAETAQNDTSLHYLCNDADFKARFAAIVRQSGTERSEKAELVSALTELNLIGKLAEKLTKLEITTSDALLLATTSATDRQVLSQQIGVRTETITRWAHLCDLLRLNGLNNSHGNLLGLAGIETLQLMAESDAQQLHLELCDLSKASDSPEPPTLQLVRSWIQHAQNLQAMVK